MRAWAQTDATIVFNARSGLPSPMNPTASVTAVSRVAFVPDLADVPAALVARARPGDLVLTLGAGSVTELGPQVLALLGGADA